MRVWCVWVRWAAEWRGAAPVAFREGRVGREQRLVVARDAEGDEGVELGDVSAAQYVTRMGRET